MFGNGTMEPEFMFMAIARVYHALVYFTHVYHLGG
jgi:hypothetical protein